ncbi:hypothetical protein [Telmatospirillum sp.]|uniref:hypothetical protein n=1 Tax=Telmatospirillum sp. TaxID=2079197 RepID=UPI00284E516E|nr:hypothetical protein [Telmatospirillum sp.]MDR3441311.1 hypothetical protein [Telmatospirillum sp.]
MLAAIGIDATRSEIFNFRYNAGAFSDDEILDSATSPPSRYIIELGRRVLKAMPSAEMILVGNPALPLRAEQILEWASEIGACPSILGDAEGFPLVYCLPRRLFEQNERFLLPLSTVVAAIDARLISLLSGQETRCFASGHPSVSPLPIPYGGDGGSQWILSSHQRDLALRLQCVNAISIIEMNDRWRDVPTVNFHPNHAGDVLFWSLASRDVEGMLYQRHIVCRDYMEIPRVCDSRLDLISLSQAPLARIEGQASETTYFIQALKTLGEEIVQNNFIIFTRFLRNYGHSIFHLIDQARFSLGDSMMEKKRTVQHHPLAVESRCAFPAKPLRILFHLSGTGWALKSYPRHYCATLCKILVGFGCDLSVIGDPELETFGASSVSCDDVESLKRAVAAHHIFVGLDSFPHHFVRHVMGWPTIGLFGNTKTCNSDAAGGMTYRTAANYLPCNPCGSLDRCLAFDGGECQNYIEPEPLAALILDMARDVYGFTVSGLSPKPENGPW